jgi:multidrug resistance efflux pump
MPGNSTPIARKFLTVAELSAAAGTSGRVASPPAHRPIRLGIFVNARLFRLLVGVGLLATAAWYIYLYAFNKVSIAGVVNAPLVTIVSQIDGYVAQDRVGQKSLLDAGQAVVTVVNHRVDNRTVTDLAGSRDAARERLVALRATIAEVTAIKADLERRSRAHMAAWSEHLEQGVTEGAAALASARIVERQTRDALSRGTSLVANGAVSRVNFDDLSYAHQRAGSEVTRTAAALDRMKGDLAAAGSGILLADSNWSDVPYSRQRLDEIDIRLAGLHNDEGALLAAIGEIETKYGAEKARVALLSREELTAPVEGVVWRSWVTPGAAVIRGTPLMEVIDCSRVYVEATTRERFFESLAPGQSVRVRLEGSSQDLPGTIRSIVGPGASLATTANVSAINHPNRTEAQLIVDIDRAALPATPGSTCNVGRSAKVYFD